MEEPSILDYLSRKGLELRKEGNKYFCSSPFSKDSSWSFCVYPHTNSFFDWSNGFGGSVWSIMSKLENKSVGELKKQHFEYEKFKPYNKQYKQVEKPSEEFRWEKYLNTNKAEIESIETYAKERRLEGGYFPGVFFTRARDDNSGEIEKEYGGLNKWIRNPALAFLHVDKNLKPCGIKFRKILTNATNRFTARGNLGLYVIDTRQDLKPTSENPVLYVVEGEANANSLGTVLRKLSISGVILSTGAVSMSLTQTGIPKTFANLRKKLIIDYDGNEELYQERLKLYSGLDAEPIKLILPKGEDINSLHMKNKLYLIENLI